MFAIVGASTTQIKGLVFLWRNAYLSPPFRPEFLIVMIDTADILLILIQKTQTSVGDTDLYLVQIKLMCLINLKQSISCTV